MVLESLFAALNVLSCCYILLDYYLALDLCLLLLIFSLLGLTGAHFAAILGVGASIQARDLRFVDLHFVGRVRVDRHGVFEEVLGVLDEHLLRLVLILLHLNLNLWSIKKLSWLVRLHLELSTGPRNDERLIDRANHLRPIQCRVAELLKALMLLYLLCTDPVGLGSRVARTARSLVHTESRLDDAR